MKAKGKINKEMLKKRQSARVLLNTPHTSPNSIVALRGRVYKIEEALSLKGENKE